MGGGDGIVAEASFPEVGFATSSWCLCSVGMMVFNKMAVTHFPVECLLVAFQMGFSCVALLVLTRCQMHFGSMRDVARWSIVVPFFAGMLLTSMLALKHAPMSLVVVFRCLSPMVSLGIERLYPNPLKVSGLMLLSMALMLIGTWVFCTQLDHSALTGIFWVILNNFFAVGDRLLQRLMLAKDQQPVDICKGGVTFLNNFEGMLPLFACAYFTGEFAEFPHAYASLTNVGMFYVFMGCLVGVGISYTGIWVQSLINATSFLVLVNANKFAILLVEALVAHTKSINIIQVIGATITILAACLYGVARGKIEQERNAGEMDALIKDKAKV